MKARLNSFSNIGIGPIPAALPNKLRDHKNLGLHSNSFSDGCVDLVNLGIITNANKVVRPGRIVASEVIGTNKVFEFINDNPMVGKLDVILLKLI